MLQIVLRLRDKKGILIGVRYSAPLVTVTSGIVLQLQRAGHSGPLPCSLAATSCNLYLTHRTFRSPKCKNPRLSGGGFWLREPDDYLLSHGNPHYHRRRVVSRSCSGWEGVGPTRYGHQAKRVVALLRNATNLGRSSNQVVCITHENPTSLSDGGTCIARRSSTRQTCYRIKPYGQLVSVS